MAFLEILLVLEFRTWTAGQTCQWINHIQDEEWQQFHQMLEKQHGGKGGASSLRQLRQALAFILVM